MLAPPDLVDREGVREVDRIGHDPPGGMEKELCGFRVVPDLVEVFDGSTLITTCATRSATGHDVAETHALRLAESRPASS